MVRKRSAEVRLRSKNSKPLCFWQALRNVAETLKEGGKVFVRDYAAGDMAEDRFTASSRTKRLAARFFVRGDGTRAYYFEKVLGCL